MMDDRQNLMKLVDFLRETDGGEPRHEPVHEKALPREFTASEPTVGHRSTVERAIEAGLVVRHADGTVTASVSH